VREYRQYRVQTAQYKYTTHVVGSVTGREYRL
jgi:hypothetical protein